MRNFALLALALATFITSCKKEDQSEIDKELILEYIATNNLDARSTESGLYYVIEKEGSGTQPTLLSEVKVAYKGYLIDGTVFDESASSGIWIPLRSVIEGWQEGIPLLERGAEAKLLIPSHLGYGSRANGSIPANSVLIFDISLLDVR